MPWILDFDIPDWIDSILNDDETKSTANPTKEETLEQAVINKTG